MIHQSAAGERNLTYHEIFLDRVWDGARCVHGAVVRLHCRETKKVNEMVGWSLVCVTGVHGMDRGSHRSRTPQLLVAERTSEELLERAAHRARRCWRMACSWLGQILIRVLRQEQREAMRLGSLEVMQLRRVLKSDELLLLRCRRWLRLRRPSFVCS
jgi:hypothetical protein